jgi:hypothetical protein
MHRPFPLHHAIPKQMILHIHLKVLPKRKSNPAISSVTSKPYLYICLHLPSPSTREAEAESLHLYPHCFFSPPLGSMGRRKLK